jgi:hypothetical protein
MREFRPSNVVLLHEHACTIDGRGPTLTVMVSTDAELISNLACLVGAVYGGSYSN